MMRSICAASFLALAMPASAQPSDAAIAVVAQAEPQFRKMLASVIFGTQTVGMSAYKLGIPGNCAVVKPAFETAIKKYLPDWQANLIKAYRANVPAATLETAAAGGVIAGGRAVGPYLEAIGTDMQAASLPILKQAAGDILLPVFEASMKIPEASINSAQREAEMAAAVADGSLYCGLQPTTGKVA